MKQYRITKYNPLFRNDKGHYTLDEWTDFSEIGINYNGIELTMEEYLKVETAYIFVAISMLKNVILIA